MLALPYKIERYIVLVLLSLLSLQFGKAQDTLQVSANNTKALKMDTISADTTSVVVLKHSPTKAALLSAVLPGLGQIYNKKYWKVPIVFAGIGISAYFYVRNQRLYKDYYEGYVNYSNTKDTRYVEQLPYMKQYIELNVVDLALNHYVDIYHSWRDWSVIFLAGTYLLGIIDATVDAYLFDYDISDDLSFRVTPTMMNTVANSNGFGLKLSFNLH